MNQHLYMKKKSIRLIKLFCLPMVLFAIYSCDKSTIQEQINPEDMTDLIVSVGGVEEVFMQDEEPMASAALLNREGIQSQSKPQVQSLESYDVVSELIKAPIAQGKVVLASRSTPEQGIANAAKALAMDPGMKYRLLLYMSDGKFAGSYHLASGTETKIDVVKGHPYTWIAYSYNSTDDVADVADHNNPKIPTIPGKEMLYATGSITVSGPGQVNKPLRVYFLQKLGRVGVQLHARGMFAGIRSANVTLGSDSYFKMGTVNLKTGEIENLQPYTVSGPLNFQNLETDSKDTIKVAYFYTADMAAIPNFEYTLNSFVLNLDDNSTRTFTSPASFSYNISPSVGISKIANLNMLESPLTVAGVRWARTNLYFSYADRAYRFRHKIGFEYPRGEEDYWNFKAPFPDGTIGKQDPCTRVYPLNVWRMPNRDEIQKLVAVDASSLRTLNNDYVEYVATGVAAPYPSNKLRINKFGFLHVIAGLFTVSGEKTDGYFWSSETGFLGGAMSGVYGYRVSDNLNVPLFGENVWEYWAISSWGGKENIRCVRN